VKATVGVMMIPTFGQQLLINQLMRGEPLNPFHVIISIVSTLFVSLILIFIAIKLYAREKIIFGAR